MRHIFRAMSMRSHLPHDGLSPLSNPNVGIYGAGTMRIPQPLSPAAVSLRTRDRNEAVGANLLPPHAETVELIRAYFSNTGLLFPFIHEENFLATYEEMRSQNFRAKLPRTWLGLLNMILAMAVCTSGWADDAPKYRAEESDVYYRRARELCKTQMLRGTTLETGTDRGSFGVGVNWCRLLTRG
jgi:hypothetical protein